MSSIRACSTAACRPSPIPARCGWRAGSARWRGWSAMPRKSTASAFPVDDAIRRIEALYKPYHRALRRAVHARSPRFRRRGADRLPFHALDRRRQGRAPARRRRAGRPLRHELRRRPSPRSSKRRCAELGYSVSRNKPYAGGFITEHYGNPAAGLHAIQLEINRALYMDERRYERSHPFAASGRRSGNAGGSARPTSRSQELRPYRAAAE